MASQKESEEHTYDFLTPLDAVGDIDLRLPLEMTLLRTRSLHGETILSADLAGDGQTWPLQGDSKAAKSEDMLQYWNSNHAVIDPCVEEQSGIFIERPPSPLLEDELFRHHNQLDDYHRALFQIISLNTASFKASFRHQPPGVLWQRELADLRRATRHGKKKRRHTNHSVSGNGHLLPPDLKCENFCLYGGDITPRLTITRYDFRADEEEIYAWKWKDSSRSAVGLSGRPRGYHVPDLSRCFFDIFDKVSVLSGFRELPFPFQ